MLFPEKMKKITALIEKEAMEPLTKELLRLGVLQFISVKDFQGIQPLQKKTDRDVLVNLKKRIESFLVQGPEDYLSAVELTTDSLVPFSVEDYTETLDKLASSLVSIKEKQKELQQKVLQTEELQRHLSRYPDTLSNIPSGSGAFLQVSCGQIQKGYLDSFKKALVTLPHTLLPGKEEGGSLFAVLITLKRDSKETDALLQKFQWIDAAFPLDETGTRWEIDRDLENKLKEISLKQEEYTAEISRIIEVKSEELCEMWKKVRLAELDDTLQDWFGSTRTTILFSGWIPLKDTEKLEKTIRELTGNRVYLEWSVVKDKREVPVKLKNPRVLRPFQNLVLNYSTPQYGTIDPTILTSITFLVMFGLMFGDWGQGAVILLIGLFGALKWKLTEKWGSLSRLLIWCGGSAILFGFLFGSCFGYAWVKPLWFDYHGVVMGHGESVGLINNIYDILGLTLKFGVCIISLSLILNWINCLSLKRWLCLFLDKKGLLGGWIYAGGVYTAWIYIASDFTSFPPGRLLFFLLAIPTCLIPVKSVLEVFIHNKGKKITGGMVGNHFIEGIVEIIETYSGFLSNTLSFMRVAGLGIAHVSLMTAFFQIGGMTSSPVFAAVIITLGNLLVIFLEGLSAGIQSLRLNYYEFFSRYFVGEGKIYDPVKLSR